MPYAISAGHEATLAAAKDILDAGGNAFDAAIAAFLVSHIAEPCMSGCGGGAFATVVTADGKTKVFDFFCQTPANKRPSDQVSFYPITVNFGTTTEVFHIGKGATGVPGAIAGVYALHEQLGSMPMRELVQPAIEFAREGVAVNDFQYYDFQLLENILREDVQSKPIFFKDDKLKQVGEKIKMPQFSDFLDVLWREGKDLFYRGEIAQRIAKDYKDSGYLTLADFENYKVAIRKPLTFNYKDKAVVTNPTPSIGGLHLAAFLRLLNQKSLPETPFTKEHGKTLFSVFQQLDQLRKSPEKLHQFLNIKNSASFDSSEKRGATTHLNIVDAHNNAISLTSSLGEGCGYFVEGTDIQLNNMLGEAALLPDGFHSWNRNQRLASMMAPTIVCGEDWQVELITGSGGAGRIPTAIGQVISHWVDYQLPIEKAVNSPRVHFDHNTFHIGTGFFQDYKSSEIPVDLFKWTEKSLFFGGVHSILKSKNQWTTAGDYRRDGVAFCKV